MADIGKRIKEKRESIGMTQEDLATSLGYRNKSTIAKIENGTNDIVQSKVVEFAKALRTTVPYLMGWEDEDVPHITDSDTYTINVNGTDFNIKPSEIEHIIKYRLLDSSGKEIVNYILDKETARTEAIAELNKQVKELDVTIHLPREKNPSLEKPHLLPNAAHERTDIEVTEEMKKHDDAFFDE
ncbi:helix-turn-helix domain-containing protein [Lacrimispora xylanolytica]|uniref:Helix-turn-helix transcriptional regulator n=1 Tax=Lacrimispora xylanolytica TaxID=29375 RepID=A0ABY7AC00_9FIRM|nr:helix-turn-helix transcriptional regulator [Lacrimispora xylanolytica]WAJ24017.1 helix-turn-helix transcriptional regulator [Lacrimispora xylanolytica]